MHVRTNWKLGLLAAALAAATIGASTAPAFAQISVVIGRTPPPLRYERRPPPPGEGFLWVDGYWATRGDRYVWVPGLWQRPPYAGAYWSHPHYDHYQDGWHYHEGHWDHDDHGDHHDDHDRDHPR